MIEISLTIELFKEYVGLEANHTRLCSAKYGPVIGANDFMM